MNEYVMKLVKAAVVGALLATAGAAFAQSAEEALRTRTAAWETAYDEADFGGVTDLYADDTRFVLSSGDTFRSRSEIEAWLGSLLDMGLAGVQLTVDEVTAGETLGWAAGTYAFVDEEGQEASSGRYHLLYEQSDGEWRIARHVSSVAEPEGDDAD